MVVLTTDAKGVVMRKEALQIETRAAAEAATPNPCKRVAPHSRRHPHRAPEPARTRWSWEMFARLRARAQHRGSWDLALLHIVFGLGGDS